jgi:dienelactone hydrolase
MTRRATPGVAGRAQAGRAQAAPGTAGRRQAGHRNPIGLLTVLVLVLTTAVACGDEDTRGRPTPERGTAGAEQHTGTGESGPYEVRTQTFQPDDVGGDFGSGTVRYPADGSRKYGVIAASPGLGADESMVAPYGELLASHGFVTITFNTKTRDDSPAQRGRQLLHALDHATKRSAAADRADPERLGVLGHSMGGGGALHAASRDSRIKAAVPLTPYAGTGKWPRITAPTLVISGSTDEIAAPSDHAEVFYEGLSSTREKAYLELDGDHFVATPPDRLVSRQVTAWFKRFLDDNTGYADTLCPPPHTPRVIESRDTCPMN